VTPSTRLLPVGGDPWIHLKYKASAIKGSILKELFSKSIFLPKQVQPYKKL
jgi:hypothetical protein